jgi:hypothetical protein
MPKTFKHTAKFIAPLLASLCFFNSQVHAADTLVRDASTGCTVFSMYKDSGVKWDGDCKNGFADGPGALEWLPKDGTKGISFFGEMREGRYFLGALISPNGVTVEGTFGKSWYPNGYAVQTWTKTAQKLFPKEFSRKPGSYDAKGNYRVTGYWRGQELLFACNSPCDCFHKRPEIEGQGADIAKVRESCGVLDEVFNKK